MNLSPKHISWADLVDVADQRKSLTDYPQWDSHLASCSSCGNKLTELQGVFQLMRSDNSKDAPRDVLANVMSLFQAQPGEERSVIKRVLALLSFDSLTATPAFGTRSGAAASRQLLYSAGETELDLHITSEKDKLVLSGQVLGRECDQAEVEISGERITTSTLLDDSCEFRISEIPPGSYKIRFRFADVEVEVPRLELRT